MISSLQFFESSCTDPHWNLAIEEEFLNTVPVGTCILYLWQNKNTVVIGRNQNPWVECRTRLLEDEGGKLARRLSGGGAVFHDLGNLNFTFIMREEDYDVDKQLSVISAAVRKLGVNATFSGRNDLLVDGKKFSGNAFYHSAGKAYHHGTILIDADMEKLSRYLCPSPAKLQAKGVASVRSRVTNLKQFNPEITVAAMKQQLLVSFEEVYGLSAMHISLTPTQSATISQRCTELGSWDWLYGSPLPFSFSCEDHFPWGTIQLQLQVNKGVVTDSKVYTDAMDWSLAPNIESALRCRIFHTAVLCQALSEIKSVPFEVIEDICTLMKQQNI